MTDDTRKADVKNWRRGYEAALSGKAFVSVGDERTSAWRLGYRDGRATRLMRVKQNKLAIRQSHSASLGVGEVRTAAVSVRPSVDGALTRFLD